jgi:Flp pilus assembly protein TadG
MTALRFRQLWRDRSGATAAEFVLILPVFILLVFGMIDVAGYAWRMNMAQKATQFGARQAVVTNPVMPTLATTGYVGQTVGGVTLTQGDVIPAAALGVVRCAKASGTLSCTCVTNPCPSASTAAAPFDAIVARMQGIEPQITAANVQIEYRGSGLGYAGDPDGMEIAPLTRVSLVNMTYQPWMGLIFNGGIGLPNVSYTLPMEDGLGTVSN